MKINMWINEEFVQDEIAPDTLLIDYVRTKGMFSVKRGCETANCGLCTVLLEGKPVLSCSVLAARANGKHVTTIEGLQKEAAEFGSFMADQGSEQCGFCSPGFIMNVISMTRELTDPSIEEIKHYLAGNLSRCTGYQGQLRAILNYLNAKKEAK
jgi:carbon-monoxide dehydrogenase small subunit